MTEIITNKLLSDLTSEEILGVLSIFIKKKEKNETELFQISNIKIQAKIKEINQILTNLNDKERNKLLFIRIKWRFLEVIFRNIEMIYELACKESIESCSIKYELYMVIL